MRFHFFEIFGTVMEINSLARYFFLQLQISFFLLNRHHHTTANASTPALTQPTTQRRQRTRTHTITYWHIQTQHSFPAQIQAHLIPSGTRLVQLYQDGCFLHDAVKTTPQMTRFRDAKVCNNLVTDEIDDHRIQSDYNKNCNIQKERNLHSVLRMRGEDSQHQ